MPFKISLLLEQNEVRDKLLRDMKPLPDVSISAYVGGARHLQPVMQKEKPDIVLLEMQTVDEAAFELIEAATMRMPGVMVLLVSADSGLSALKRAMRAGVRDVLPSPLTVQTVQVAVDYLKDAQALNSRVQDSMGTLYAFMPAKGGCGCTFLVTNLAYLLHKAGKRVLIIDLNLYFGDAASFLSDRSSEASVVDLARQSRRLDGSLLEASVLKVRDNLHVLMAPDLPYHLEEVTPDTMSAVLGLARSEYDFVLLDMGRSMDPASVKALDMAERVYLVIQQSLPALKDAKRIVKVFEGLGYSQEKVQVIVNGYSRSSPIPVGEVENVTRHKVARALPSSPDAVQTSINQGVPLAKLAPRDPVARSLQDWAQELSPVTVKAGKQSWFATLTGGL